MNSELEAKSVMMVIRPLTMDVLVLARLKMVLNALVALSARKMYVSKYVEMVSVILVKGAMMVTVKVEMVAV